MLKLHGSVLLPHIARKCPFSVQNFVPPDLRQFTHFVTTALASRLFFAIEENGSDIMFCIFSWRKVSYRLLYM